MKISEMAENSKYAEILKPTKPLTNEEWLRSLSTEEKAEFIIHIVEFGLPHELYEAIGYDKKEVIKWLREKHT